jgi:hypothetical protein
LGAEIMLRDATRVHPFLLSAVARRRVTDSIDGFRALRIEVLRDPRLDPTPPWLPPSAAAGCPDS